MCVPTPAIGGLQADVGEADRMITGVGHSYLGRGLKRGAADGDDRQDGEGEDGIVTNPVGWAVWTLPDS